MIKNPPCPKAELFFVQILSDGGGELIQKNVLALNIKEALLAVIAELPETHPAWQWPGWRVQAYAQRKPVILLV
ncbi:MAG: hypothetical protein ACLP7I_12135 [Limisphaerales bacterium]